MPHPGNIVVMTDGTTTSTIPGDSPMAVELRTAVHGGDLDLVRRLIAGNTDLASARFVARGGSGTALHFVTDWPGFFPNGPEIVHLLIDAGADPNATTTGPGRPETPLHYAASSDDVDVAVALIDRGADLEIPDGSIGTPLDNAIGYACWHVARLLATRAHASRRSGTPPLSVCSKPWRLSWCPGSTERRSRRASGMRAALGNAVPQSAYCSAGADLAWVPDYAEGTAVDAATGLGTRQENVITWLQSIGARSAQAEE